MTRIERATPRDFERVLPLLEHFRNPSITPGHWRSLFHYSWPCDDDTRGFILLDGDRVAGYFGVILYERNIDGRIEKFANLTSWITLPEYRNHSLKLFKAVTSIEDRTLTCVSPGREVLPLYLKSGFRELESRAGILYPIPSLSAPSAWLGYKATTNPANIRPRLDTTDQAIFDHHRPHPCGHLLIYNNREYCYAVFTRTKGLRYHFAKVHYISNPSIFVKNLDRVRFHLALAARALLVMIEARLLPQSGFTFNRMVDLGHPQVYKSNKLSPAQIDGLYTESILLEL